MSEKDIKTKPKTTTKAVQNTPKAADRFAKEAVKDIKTVSKDVFIKNIVDKRLDTRQSEQPQRAEVKQPNRLKTPTIPPLIPFAKRVNILRKIS